MCVCVSVCLSVSASVSDDADVIYVYAFFPTRIDHCCSYLSAFPMGTRNDLIRVMVLCAQLLSSAGDCLNLSVRSRGDLIEAYKIITGKESTQWERFFELAPSKGTPGHRYKLFKKRKGTLGQKFFSAGVVDLWNELDDSTVSVDNVTAFKRKLGKLGY